jgi:hypothetical protein
MRDTCRHHFEHLLRPLFPHGAKFVPYPPRLSFLVDWPLPTAERPQRRSKRIHLWICSDVLRLYESAPQRRRLIDSRIVGFVQTRLAMFDPAHGKPASEAPPLDRWDFTFSFADR